MEYWADITDFPNYEVSNQGAVRNRLTLRYLRGGINQKGYHYVVLRSEGHSYNRSIHKLVVAAFLTPPGRNLVPIHRDGDRSNNSSDNFIWRSHTFLRAMSNQNFRTRPLIDDAIRCLETKEKFENSRDAAYRYGLIEVDIVRQLQGEYSNLWADENQYTFEFIYRQPRRNRTI